MKCFLCGYEFQSVTEIEYMPFETSYCPKGARICEQCLIGESEAEKEEAEKETRQYKYKYRHTQNNTTEVESTMALGIETVLVFRCPRCDLLTELPQRCYHYDPAKIMIRIEHERLVDVKCGNCDYVLKRGDEIQVTMLCSKRENHLKVMNNEQN